jgi:glucose 1-dehydrogenase
MKQTQVVIITGGSRGIGYGIACRFAKDSAKLAIADIDGKAALDAAERLKTEGASDAMGVCCDVSKTDSVDAMLSQVLVKFGRVDVLVNNAGICPFIPAMDMSPETFQKTVDINLTGPFLCTRAVAKQMISQGSGGRIVFITSLNENFTGESQLDYASSKGGLRMQMKAWCLALGKHGITCNAVAPGIILTDMGRTHWEKPDNADYIKRRVPVGRIGSPEDIGKTVAFLASDEAQYISGTSITVDGGYSAACP